MIHTFDSHDITIQKACKMEIVFRHAYNRQKKDKKGINVFIPRLLVIDFYALFLSTIRIDFISVLLDVTIFHFLMLLEILN